MESNKPNKIREVVRLQQILKKWKKVATSSSSSSSSSTSSSSTSSNNTSCKGIKFLKRTLSFTDVSSNDTVPKGFLAVCVGKELKRFIIPTHYLTHQAFQMLLQQAEEEFGFHQEGVLKIPIQVSAFEKILKIMEDKKEVSNKDNITCCASDCEITPPHHPQMCT